MSRTVRSIFLFVAMAMLVPCSFSPAFAAPGAEIGSVDFSTLLIFHPQMANYDLYRNAFRKNTVRGQVDGQRKAGEQAGKTRELAEKRRLLEGRLEEARRNMDRQTKALQDDMDTRVAKLATGTAAVERNMFQVKMQNLHQRSMAEIRALIGQVELIDQASGKVSGEDVTGQFTSSTETEQVLRAMMREIREKVARVAKNKGIAIVIDSGPRDYLYVREGKEGELPTENLLQKLFSSGGAPTTGSPDAPALQGKYVAQYHLGYFWHRSRLAVLAPFQSILAGNSIVVGGVDLTQECLSAMLTQNRVPPTCQQAILSVLQVAK